MKKFFINAIIICALCLSACSQGEMIDNVKNAGKVVASEANDFVNNIISESEDDTNSSIDNGESTIDKKKLKPDLVQIRSMCELATIKCYYNNVLRSDKLKGTGMSHWAEDNRRFWIEYSGNVFIGIDMSEINMEIDGDIVTITIPPAKVLDIKNNFYSDDNIIQNNDNGWKKNPLKASDISNAINQANEQLIEEYNNNSQILVTAQNRAKLLIENYILQIGTATNVDYEINWVYE